jgi:anti-sigma regulatory factor (Ser/Thr protein kinase)
MQSDSWHEDCTTVCVVAIVASDESFLLRFDSDAVFVDYAVDIIDNLLSYRGFDDRTSLLILCRELLNNAIVHGKRSDSHKSVTLRLERLAGGQYRIETEDGGMNIDPESMESIESIEQGDEPSGLPGSLSGLSLIGALANRVLFNTRGNRVTVFVNPQATVLR